MLYRFCVQMEDCRLRGMMKGDVEQTRQEGITENKETPKTLFPPLLSLWVECSLHVDKLQLIREEKHYLHHRYENGHNGQENIHRLGKGRPLDSRDRRAFSDQKHRFHKNIETLDQRNAAIHSMEQIRIFELLFRCSRRIQHNWYSGNTKRTGRSG